MQDLATNIGQTFSYSYLERSTQPHNLAQCFLLWDNCQTSRFLGVPVLLIGYEVYAFENLNDTA